ncbi:hypothetical protein K490DRAFT_53294 [Saccharata proteae CBS 121410]|uniref:Chromatin remodeling complex subunit n=1 Tax=Saccharata proteae CBS 121410 TaxID=1314787 RepID=A0A9P4I285_9PEZI|nr:hypothetical protein K490DRAFT_53294 [Saccharata proteae CBS 121410]
MSESETGSVIDDERVAELQRLPNRRTLFAVVPEPIQNLEDRAEYETIEGWDRVVKVYREVEIDGDVLYEVRFGDTHTEMVPFEQLLDLDEGPSELKRYQEAPDSESSEVDELAFIEEDDDMQLRTRRKKPANAGFVDYSNLDLEGDEEDSSPARPAPRGLRSKTSRSGTARSRMNSSTASELAFEATDSSPDRSIRRSSRVKNTDRRKSRIALDDRRSSTKRLTRSSRRQNDDSEEEEQFDSDNDEDDDDDDSDIPLLRSDILPNPRKRKRSPITKEKAARVGTRRSHRDTRYQDTMEEVGQEDVYREESEGKRAIVAPKATGARETFQRLPEHHPFRMRHIQSCDTCGLTSVIGPLVYCQGCLLSYHRPCLGHRTSREHLVTKVGDENFVLQCRRCIGTSQKKDPNAPNQAICQVCNETGPACRPFRNKKTPAQEQKEREENDGEDPVIHVNPELINNVNNVLFRCVSCLRGFHFHHLPAKSPHSMDIDEDEEELAERRFNEYSRDWTCRECRDMPAKVSGIVAWKPIDEETYPVGTPCEDIPEDEKAYLLKWDKLSYFRAAWMPGAWTWGVTASAMRRAFFKRGEAPKMRTEDAIPEEYLRIDIVLDVKYTSIVEIRTEEIDKARIKEVDEALIKYKGLGYEDAVWEKVPMPEDGDRWADFVTAYNDWVLGRYVHAPKPRPLQSRLEKARAKPFTELEKQKQPDNLQQGMELMKYQIDGLNWLYYQWYSKKNGILADEMGLGKTIQVIAFLATMIQEHNCFPFLVVVPNSTCANWRREIKQWAPSLRVVTYFGSAQARKMAHQYEMFPEGSKDLRCHIVVTSYEAAQDDSCTLTFKNVSWAGMVIDEGQRLKSDKTNLYSKLMALKVPFRALLTGTPLQNNARELFNLLQFLDDNIKAAELEEQYTEMTSENIKSLHDLIRPYILRRTKAQVLTFLPPMAQIIVPISMSVLQKRLYKSILEKNPELLKALFSANRPLKQNERANLSNILMQLRKCLCHPFVYSQEIEERIDERMVSHRNLVEASAKLQLLELLLPKLKERGHRVLIFSQFLDMLNIVEDFLDGLEMGYKRLDGTIGSLEKQKRIDEFNAPNSPLFAFLLSTRAGGVGINLATADTVIILDPDFNPHQDIQALSRAHRIGQKKKVLCFQLMTKSSAEEKIVQIGRKKMALDHVVVEALDDEDFEDKDFESVLKYGAKELFSEDSAAHDIKYDAASVEKLLDRSQMENTKAGADDTAESQFSFARVWANEEGALQESLPVTEEEEESAPDPSVWDKILKEREELAAREAAEKRLVLGRGRRARVAVDYIEGDREEVVGNDAAEGVPSLKPNRRRQKKGDDSDTDFQAEASEDDDSVHDEADHIDAGELVDGPNPQNRPGGIVPPATGNKPTFTNRPAPPPSVKAPTVKKFSRVREPQWPPALPSHLPLPPGWTSACPACRKAHAVGACPLKLAGPEYCNLCGLAHYGYARSCPHIGSETQVREMIEALKQSSEPRHLVEAATKYLRGVKERPSSAKLKDCRP